MTDKEQKSSIKLGPTIFSMNELLDLTMERLLNPPQYPQVVIDDNGAFLVLEDGREYRIKNDPASALRLLNHLSQKSWTDREFFQLATQRICESMGWWYPEPRDKPPRVVYEGDAFTVDDLTNNPEFPKVIISDDGEFFLAVSHGREYELRKDPLSLLRLLNSLAEKSWADNTFFELATFRICAAFGWDLYEKSSKPSLEGEPFYLNKTALLERGWTSTMIDNFLGEPDDLWFSPQFMVESKLYDYERILETEESDDWQKEFMNKLPLRVASSNSSLRDILHRWSLAVTNHKRRATRHKRSKK
jgi:hypothetical protein